MPSDDSYTTTIPSGYDALRVPIDSSSAFAVALHEVARQDEIHPAGFIADRDGIRLALAAMQDELDESLEAFQGGEKRRTDEYWPKTEEELVQTIAVGLRLLRSLHAKRGPSFDV